ncbi:MAG TPA: hypothetical protein DEP66_00055, partial [Acidimicrobiaceae bacterium]|nr:hypothetical protein [Acidimicrobiaceae bacterium]
AAALADADHGDSRVRAAWDALAWSKRQRTKFLDPQYYADALAGKPPERAAQVVLVILDDHRRRAHRLGTTTRQGALLSDVLGDIAAHVRDEFCGGD